MKSLSFHKWTFFTITTFLQWTRAAQHSVFTVVWFLSLHYSDIWTAGKLRTQSIIVKSRWCRCKLMQNCLIAARFCKTSIGFLWGYTVRDTTISTGLNTLYKYSYAKSLSPQPALCLSASVVCFPPSAQCPGGILTDLFCKIESVMILCILVLHIS